MQEEKKRILKMVEEGKITAAEAITLIEALENPTKKSETTTEPSPHVNFDSSSSNNYENKSYKRPSFMDKFTDFIDSTFQKIKDVDLDFNFGPHKEVNHIFQHRDVYLVNMSLDISNGDIKILPWDERDVRVECQAKVYKVSSQEEAKKEFLKSVYFSIDGDAMRFSVEPKQIKMNTVFYIPRFLYEKITIRMFNGHIKAENLNVKMFKAKTANGNIQFSNLSGNDFEFETANGHIRVENSRAHELEAETLNGTIKANGSFVKTDLQSFSGNIICEVLDSRSETVLVKSKTGSIDLFVADNTNLEVNGKLKSNIGGFTCELTNLEILDEKKDVVQKEMSFVANRGQERKLYVDAESRTGSIVVKRIEQ
ncbi:DUF4097 family beta strand repeat-containing protein [Calidifontibacillus oryziterrae]|uniref:DUF4097 family beta strand repeat-containing protein n=1 Tax=Calidifontibacillus oryziterrae TaxID=1191699 RepID=UPI0002E93D16|nr:DUF4097 domain-containing protein [Calidifontibacillus oryziterrae]